MPKTQNTINVGQLMRKHTKYNVSPKAVHEMSSRLNMFIETHMETLSKIASKHKRKTIFEDDVTEMFSFRDNDIAQE